MRRGGGERRLRGMARGWDGGAEIKNGDFSTVIFRAF